nr:hypothetical protein [uncultured Acetatifactor sp.]
MKPETEVDETCLHVTAERVCWYTDEGVSRSDILAFENGISGNEVRWHRRSNFTPVLSKSDRQEFFCSMECAGIPESQVSVWRLLQILYICHKLTPLKRVRRYRNGKKDSLQNLSGRRGDAQAVV